MRAFCRLHRPYSRAAHRAEFWRRYYLGRNSASTPPEYFTVLGWCLFVFDQILAEWRGRCKLFCCGLYIKALARKIIGDGTAQRRICDVMGRIGGVGHVASRELMLALRAGFDPLQSVCDRVVDGLIVADLEM